MDTLLEIAPYVRYIGGAAVVGAGTVWVIRRFFRKKQKRVCGVDYPRDVVILHQESCGPFAPSLSPFVVKLHTYLRLANIPYQVDASHANVAEGPKKKVPWIEFNGEVVGDTYFIIQFLNQRFNFDLNAKLDKVQKAQARALQVWLEDLFGWLVSYSRWVIMTDEFFDFMNMGYSWLIRRAVKKHIHKLAYAHGAGRHSTDEINDILKNDLQMLSDYLGDKKYFMGDEPTLVDCTVFGQLSQLWCHTPDSFLGKQQMKELSNLEAYFLRMKDRLYPDWDECLSVEKAKNKTFCKKSE